MIIRYNTSHGSAFFGLRCLTFQVDSMMLSICHIFVSSFCGIHIHQICLETNTLLFAGDQVLIPDSKDQGPNELKKRKKYTVLQNAGVVNDAVDGSYCYRWGLNG